MGGPFLIIGGILFLIGGIIALANIKNMKRRKRIMDTPTSPISHAPGGGLVEVKGRILPGEQGVIETPFSGRHAVWVRITVQELRRSGKNSHWVTIINEADGRPFYVDDGSGQRARIEPGGANVVLDKQQIATSGTFNDASPRLQYFLSSRGIATTTFFGFNKSMRYEEEVLGPGDTLYALGPSRRDPGPPVNDGYRMVPGTLLVLFPAPGPEGELILTNKTEEQLVSKLLWGFVAGCITAGIGGAVGIVGVIAALVG